MRYISLGTAAKGKYNAMPRLLFLVVLAIFHLVASKETNKARVQQYRREFRAKRQAFE